MTEQEQQELNEWIARQLGWEKSNGGSWLKHIDDCLIQCALKMPTFVSPPVHFAEVKREIERRGWSWLATSTYNNLFHFAIFGPLDDEREGFQAAPELAKVMAETEELAGCLAFKAAAEATDGKDENPDGAG